MPLLLKVGELEINGVTYKWPGEHPAELSTFTVDPDGAINLVPSVMDVFWSVEGASASAGKSSYSSGILISPVYIPGFLLPNTSGILRIYVVVKTGLPNAGTPGLYDKGGNLLFSQQGGIPASTTGAVTVDVNVGSGFNLRPGQYYFAVTWSGTAGAMAAASVTGYASIPRNGVIASGGGNSLPATIDLGSISKTQYVLFCALSGF